MHKILGNAKKNKQADRVKDMLLQESLSTEVLTERIAKGQVVIPYNNKKILKKPWRPFYPPHKVFTIVYHVSNSSVR